MSSISSLSDHAKSRLLNYLGIALLIALVLLLAWLQFRWLTQLSQEEESRRRVALEVAATNYSERISRELNALLDRFTQGTAPHAELLAQEPLVDAVVSFRSDGSPRISTRTYPEPNPAGWAEVQQRLGRPLTRALLSGTGRAGLWLDPPALVRCANGCEAALLSPAQFAERLLGPTAQRMFADFGDDLYIVISSEGSGPNELLLPLGERPKDFRVIDLNEDLLRGVPVPGPADRTWVIKINHGGVSLKTTVARSHLRNVLLSVGVLFLLVVSIALVISNSRRQATLAREHLYFVAGVSHELRTPLAVISSAADNLADNALEADRIPRYGEMIRTEARKLGAMIENVLQFTQSASASRPRTQSRIQIGELLQHVLDQKRALLENRELQLDIPAALPGVVGDPAALESALTNLVVNAARYARGGNWISIVARSVRVRPRGYALRISISNPVAGKPDPNPERLFEPFYRGRNVRGEGPPGTGIGLAVARNIVRQHGGGITIDTASEGIITFTLFLPVHEPEPPAHTAG